MIIDGKNIAYNLNLRTTQRLKKLPFRPLLVDIVIGNDLASLSYVGIKQRTSQKYGFDFELVQLSEQATTEEVIKSIEDQTQRDNLCGLIIQLPLPRHLDQQQILNQIPEAVDVDLLSQQSSQKFYQNESVLVPPTAGAIFEIMNSLNEEWFGKNILVLGQGDLVGKPITQLLRSKNYVVLTADETTTSTLELVKQADLIICGVGKPGLVTGEMVKDGVIVIDAGTSESSGSIKGDVDYETVAPKAKFITPVPGGVGPVTVAKLLENVIIVAENK